MSLLKSCQTRHVTFTDCHHKVLNFLVYNLKLNFGEGDRSRDVLRHHTESGPPTVIHENNVKDVVFHKRINHEGDESDETRTASVQHLDWTRFNPDALQSTADVILGSDIVYERSLLPPLAHVIRTVLSSASATAVAYIACTERSHTTLSCFESALEKEQLKHEVVHKGFFGPTEVMLSSDVQHKPVRLYKIWP